MSRENERADVIVNEGGSSRFSWARTNLVLTLLALLMSLLLMLVVFGFVYIVFKQFEIIYYLFVALLGSLPIAAMTYIGLVIYKKFRSVQVIDVKQYGTVLRNARGQLQVISPVEMYALETNDARRTPVTKEVLEVEAPPYTAYADTTLPLPFPTPFPARYPVSSVSNVETEPETAVEPVLAFVASENDAARLELEARQNALYKERIRKLYAQGIPLRAIAKIVKLEGRKYKQFQQLVSECGIDATGNQLPDIEA